MVNSHLCCRIDAKLVNSRFLHTSRRHRDLPLLSFPFPLSTTIGETTGVGTGCVSLLINLFNPILTSSRPGPPIPCCPGTAELAIREGDEDDDPDDLLPAEPRDERRSLEPDLLVLAEPDVRWIKLGVRLVDGPGTPSIA